MKASSLETATFWVTLIGALATVGTLVFAIYLGLHEVRALRQEAKDREQAVLERERERRRAQAELINGYMVLTPDTNSMKMLNGMMHVTRWTGSIEVVNSSKLPIYDLVTTSLSSNRIADPFRTGARVLLGGQTHHAHVPPEPSDDLNHSPVELQFRDAAGVEWHRTTDGRLHQVDGGV